MRHRHKSDFSCGGATCRICRCLVQVDLGRGAWAVVLFQPALLLRRNPLLLASSVDPWERRKPDARLRVVRLAEGATERPVVEGSRRQVRNDRGAVSSEPAIARLTAETKPFRSRKTSQSACIALAVDRRRLDLDEPLAPIAVHWSQCRAVGQCRGDGRHRPHISWRDPVAAGPSQRTRSVDADTSRREAPVDLSVSRSDHDIDRQVQLDKTRLQQRHGQVIVQFNPGVGVAWGPTELLEDDLAGLSKG